MDYRDGDAEHIAEWVTQRDIDVARRITAVAAEQGLAADPGSVSVIELELDAVSSARGCGRGVGAAFPREVDLAPKVVAERIAAAVAAGGTVVDDSQAPMLTVTADQESNRGVVCVDVTAVKER